MSYVYSSINLKYVTTETCAFFSFRGMNLTVYFSCENWLYCIEQNLCVSIPFLLPQGYFCPWEGGIIFLFCNSFIISFPFELSIIHVFLFLGY